MKLLARIVSKLEGMGVPCALIAGGLVDLIDVELLIKHDPSLRAIVETRLGQLPRRMNLAWKAFQPRLGPAPPPHPAVNGKRN